MHTDLMNQEIARLHRAETLRMSSRHVAVEKEPAIDRSALSSLVARFTVRFRRTVWNAPAARTHW